jgi:hypothetical protein
MMAWRTLARLLYDVRLWQNEKKFAVSDPQQIRGNVRVEGMHYYISISRRLEIHRALSANQTTPWCGLF